ncbi:hypothetical protein ABE488_09055 [Luteimonas sp. TWI662]|uniref:hypothetical protein n=1 Tax=Luteimonas sp. TWI662 TaxID=3136789 RepID=UPI0032080B16
MSAALQMGPIHQPGVYNIEAWDGARWRGGMNRSNRSDAIATAERWSVETVHRHRVFGLDGAVIFDTAWAEAATADHHNAELIAAARDMRNALSSTRGVLASALRAAAPDMFESDADIAEHLTIRMIDAALERASGAQL